MKLLFPTLFILACFTATLAQDTPVKLYVKADAVGDAQAIPVGSFKVDAKNIPSPPGEKIAFSVRVDPGFVVEFCSAALPPAPAACESFQEGVHNLTIVDFVFIKVSKAPAAPMPPVIGSTPVAPPINAGPPVLVYEQRSWLGRSQVFFPGMYRADRNEFGKLNDNQARSVIVTKGFKAVFCMDVGMYSRGAGDCEEYTEGKFNIRNANDISFIKIIDLNDKSPDDETMPAILYEDAGQGGKLQGLDVGTYAAGQLRKLNDAKVSSISVKKGFRAQICSHVDGKEDQCEEFDAGKHDRKLKDKPASIKVFADANKN